MIAVDQLTRVESALVDLLRAEDDEQRRAEAARAQIVSILKRLQREVILLRHELTRRVEVET